MKWQKQKTIKLKIDNNDRLLIVLSEFKAWRKKRNHSKERIPEKLLKKVAQLTRFYTIGRIARTLNLNSAKIKEAKQMFLGIGSEEKIMTSKNPEISFLELPNLRNKNSISSEIVIKKQNGTRFCIRIAGTPTEKLLQNLNHIF